MQERTSTNPLMFILSTDYTQILQSYPQTCYIRITWHTEQFLLEIEESSTGTLVAHFVRSLQLLVHTVTASVTVKEVLFSSHTAYPTLGTVELPFTYVIIKQTTLQTSVCTKIYSTFLTRCGHLQTGIIIQTWHTTHSPALHCGTYIS